MANMYMITPGYLQAMRTRLMAGRDLDQRDTKDAPLVALVNEAFVRQLLPGEDPIGKRFRHGTTGKWIQIAGVVEDGKYRSLGETPSPTVFEAMEQDWRSNADAGRALAAAGSRDRRVCCAAPSPNSTRRSPSSTPAA